MMPKMKAYAVSDKNGNVDYDIVTFAESRGKAISYALHDESYCGCYWTEMRAIRKPQLDKYYRGKLEMDWFDMGDRVAMVRDAGYQCSYEVDVTIEKCEACPAHKWCERWEREQQ